MGSADAGAEEDEERVELTPVPELVTAAESDEEEAVASERICAYGCCALRSAGWSGN